jgi:hypothetical protein
MKANLVNGSGGWLMLVRASNTAIPVNFNRFSSLETY